MPPYTSAGADAAGQYDEQFRQLIANDPQIQEIIRRVWGDTPVSARPSDTPKHLEKPNDQASKEIAQILASRGMQLPDRTFVNPRTASLEGHRGWSGLSGLQKALAIAAAAGVTGGAGLALAGGAGAAGAAGGAGSALGGSGVGVTTGLGGLGAIGTSVPIGAGTAAGLGAAGTAGAASTLGGGMSLGKGLTTAAKLGQLASGAAGNLQAGRYADASMNMDRDRLAAQNFNTQQNAVFNRNQQELAEKQFALNAPQTRAKQAALGDLLARIQDVHISGLPQGVQMANLSGGLRPSNLGPNARQSGEELSRQALLKLMDQSDQKFSPMPLLQPPRISQTPQAGGSENLLGILGTIGGIAGGLQEVRRTPYLV